MDLLLCAWGEVAAAACKAIQENDLLRLAEVDAALHHRFFNQLDAGDPESRHQFAVDLGDVTESAEARQIPEADAIRRYLTKWEHLGELASALGDDVKAEDAARDLLRSRQYGERLLEMVAAAGDSGIRSGDLARQLGISQSHLSNLLGEFDEAGIIDRRQFGKYVHVRLGLVGQLVAERGPRLVNPSPPRVTDDPSLWLETPAHRACYVRFGG